MRAGKLGAAEDLFFNEQLMAMERPEMGDLKALRSEREAFVEQYRATYGRDVDLRRAGSAATQLFRFVHVIEVGNWVVCQSKSSRFIHLGRVSGPYEFQRRSDFAHRRPVHWESKQPKALLGEAAQKELGSLLALFAVTRHRDEVLALFNVMP